ncbi:MAG: sigma 54-interacting transcriptional regulator, partial [Planctomycetota bacterium]
MPDGLHVLVVDDELGIRGLCREVLESAGCTVEEAPDLSTARRKLADGSFGLVILDVRLPDGSGLDLFRRARRSSPELPVAIITGHASVEDAVEAVKNGALDYITKPFDVSRIEGIAELAARRRPEAEPGDREAVEFHGILAASREMRSVCGLIERAAASGSTVLVQGESGTGKELVARAIHEAGPAADEPFVPIDCGSIPATLLESELFGHKKGAFTGAHADTRGLFRSAGRGTVFLDEIGEL